MFKLLPIPDFCAETCLDCSVALSITFKVALSVTSKDFLRASTWTEPISELFDDTSIIFSFLTVFEHYTSTIFVNTLKKYTTYDKIIL